MRKKSKFEFKKKNDRGVESKMHINILNADFTIHNKVLLILHRKYVFNGSL